MTRGDIGTYLRKYVLGQKNILSLRMNPQQIADEGGAPETFQEITRANAYWWEE